MVYSLIISQYTSVSILQVFFEYYEEGYRHQYYGRTLGWVRYRCEQTTIQTNGGIMTIIVNFSLLERKKNKYNL
jgi:hypothetical protein